MQGKYRRLCFCVYILLIITKLSYSGRLLTLLTYLGITMSIAASYTYRSVCQVGHILFIII